MSQKNRKPRDFSKGTHGLFISSKGRGHGITVIGDSTSWSRGPGDNVEDAAEIHDAMYMLARIPKIKEERKAEAIKKLFDNITKSEKFEFKINLFKTGIIPIAITYGIFLLWNFAIYFSFVEKIILE